MLPVQVDVRPLCFSASDVEVPPPVGVACQRVTRVFVQSVVELILNESDNHAGDKDDRPVCLDERKKLANQHVEEAGSRGS